VAPELVFRDNDGNVNTVRFEQVGSMLLNEFLKEHKKVEEQQSKIENQRAAIAELKLTVGQLTAQLKEQAAQIQKARKLR